jgi:hypothetical protein
MGGINHRSANNSVKLWELRNEEVHGKTEEQQKKTRKLKLCIELRRINNMRDTKRCLLISQRY